MSLEERRPLTFAAGQSRLDVTGEENVSHCHGLAQKEQARGKCLCSEVPSVSLLALKTQTRLESLGSGGEGGILKDS